MAPRVGCCSKRNVLIINASITAFLVISGIFVGFNYGGYCPRPKQLEPNFERVKYLGRWYEFARSPNYFENAGCATAQYYDKGNNYISVNNFEFDPY